MLHLFISTLFNIIFFLYLCTLFSRKTPSYPMLNRNVLPASYQLPDFAVHIKYLLASAAVGGVTGSVKNQIVDSIFTQLQPITM
jgi:hypothetical protein